MRIVFLYVRDGAFPGQPYNPNIKSTNFYADRVKEEGYYYLLERMVETKIVDDVLIFIESNKGQGYVDYPNTKIKGMVIPDINDLHHHIRPDDIIWVRGGWKTWYDPFLLQMKADKHWMLLYAANTGRERWNCWDIVFNDLTGNNKIDARNTLQFDFKKPINLNIFYPKWTASPKYDLCIGASHIHDKKGQWRTIEALVEYQKIFGERLSCIMPGAFHGGAKTSKILKTLENDKLKITMPGMMSRIELNDIYNQSKYFIHLGEGGQGDRGPLEAMTCGVPVIIGNTRRHSRVVYQNDEVSTVIPEDADAEAIARKLYYLVKIYNPELRKTLYNHYRDNADMEEIILPEIATLFDIFKKHPKQDMTEIRKIYR